MKIKHTLSTLKTKFLPPSSRSFHSATYDIRQDIRGLYGEIASLRKLVEQQNKHIERLEEQLAIHDAHMKQYGNVLFKKEDESPHDMRKRFFHSLPKADEPFRTFQLCNGKLLHTIEALCQQNHLDYWLSYGSLIGAASCEGHIPWDDDIDICMMREDAMKLYHLLKTNPDYEITLVYDLYAHVKQYRFCSRNKDIPCFIDISIWDWASDLSETHEMQIRELRRQLISDICKHQDTLTYWKKHPYLFAPDSGFVVQWSPVDKTLQDPLLAQEEISRIDAIFAASEQKAYDLGIFCRKEDAHAVSFGLENYSEDAPWRPFLWSLDMVFPTAKTMFEGKLCRIPHQTKAYCDVCYPGWPYLPKDILGHNHFSRNLLKDTKVLEAMHEFLGK